VRSSVPFIEKHGGAIGLAGVAVSLIATVAFQLIPTFPRWILWAVLGLGIALLLIAVASPLMRRAEPVEVPTEPVSLIERPPAAITIDAGSENYFGDVEITGYDRAIDTQKADRNKFERLKINKPPRQE